SVAEGHGSIRSNHEGGSVDTVRRHGKRIRPVRYGVDAAIHHHAHAADGRERGPGATRSADACRPFPNMTHSESLNYKSSASRVYPARLTGSRRPSVRTATRFSRSSNSTRASQSRLSKYDR